jgi:glutathione synthase/RimK-type ligase-like ATP-grasp enzyme
MILLWGVPGERPLDVVRSALGDLRKRAFVFDQRAVGDWSIELSVGSEIEGRLVGPAGAIDLASIRAVYARPYDPAAVPAVAAAGPQSRAADHARALHEALRVWSELTPAYVVNRLSAMASNSSKPYQARIIHEVGFAVPPTLVTTDPAAAKKFIAHHKDAIYKSVSAVRSVVAKVTPEIKETRLDAVTCCPTQFQGYVSGTDVRVHVVGDETFACEIATSATDYRYPGNADVARKLVELPKEIAERCRAVTHKLGLVVAGIDLRRGRHDWVCFEVNPSPAFTYFDLDGAIARAVARQLGGNS